MADFLLEIGTEEIPAGMVYDLAVNLGQNVSSALEKLEISSSARRSPSEVPMFAFHASNPAWRLMDGMHIFGAPRRIGFLIEGLPTNQADRVEAVVGPAISIARNAFGAWTKAAEGFARKQGVALEECREVPGPKGPCIGFEREVKGRATAAILAEVVPATVEAMYIPKSQRWGMGNYQFVRPVRWVVALLDNEVVDLEVKGVSSGRASRGHRIHGAASMQISSASDYFDTLREQFVIVDPIERETKVKDELRQLASEVLGVVDFHGGAQEDSDFSGGLLATLIFTSEYPTAFLGDIPEELLTLPQPILSTCLREHQKSFAVLATLDPSDPLPKIPVTDAGLALRPYFLAVMDGPKGSEKRCTCIKTGHENVTVARLKDARFFYEHDLKVPLERRLEELKGIVFHPKIGTYYDKALRMEKMAKKLAPAFGEPVDLPGEAALLCKADLASLLIQEKEFTSLQGVAGGLYSKKQGKHPLVAQAIEQHYTEPIPSLDKGTYRFVNVIVALADRLDNLIQFFKIGLVPTGSKDPFALRRAGIQVVDLLLQDPPVHNSSRLVFSLGNFLRQEAPTCYDKLEPFLLERLRYHFEHLDYAYLEGQPNPRGDRFTYDEINAILGQGLDDLLDMRNRLTAVHNTRLEHPEDFDHLSVAFKRVRNILKGLPEHPLEPSKFLPAEDKEGAAERVLYEAHAAVAEEAARSLDAGDYAAALRRLATLRPAVDRFFDDVLVMCDPEGKDPAKTALQNNRLALLQRVVGLFNRVADLSEIVPRGMEGR